MRLILIIFFTILSCFSVSAQKRVDRTLFISLLNEGRFQEVFNRAMEIRKQPYGKNAVIDYFIAKSLCMEGYKDQSLLWLDYIDTNYPLNREQRNFIRSEREQCRGLGSTASAGGGSSPMAGFTYINYAPLPEAGVHGKGGYTLSCYDNIRSSIDSMLTIQELEQRVFDLGEKKQALDKIRSIVPAGYAVDTSGRFVVVTYKGHDLAAADIKRVNKKLESAYSFFLKSYKLTPSDKIFSVYLVPDRPSLRSTAQQVHKIQLPRNSIGYSSVSDLSLLGIANPRSVGTLYHELFHLTIRTELGDIPAWLDEGIACMYAVYNQKDDELYGASNTWRVLHFKSLAMLSAQSITVPTLAQLISMSWDEFEGGESRNTCVSSIHYALSNMFMLFLQEKGLVYPMVDAYRDRLTTRTDSLGTGLDNVALVEKVYGNNIALVSEDFYGWLKSQYNIDIASLISRSPYYQENGLPLTPEFAGLKERVDSLFIAVKHSQLISDKELIKLQQSKSELWYRYKSNQQQLNDEKTRELSALAENITDDEVFESRSVRVWEKRIAETEAAYHKLEQDLLDILTKSSSRKHQ